jgi:hypothetical protein
MRNEAHSRTPGTYTFKLTGWKAVAYWLAFI